MVDLCEKCNKNPKAINYKKDNKTFYRRLCDACIIEKKKNIKLKWQHDGYKKKFKCESCGFTAKHNSQLTVIEVQNNYKTICLNCEVSFKIEDKIEFRKGDLKSDF